VGISRKVPPFFLAVSQHRQKKLLLIFILIGFEKSYSRANLFNNHFQIGTTSAEDIYFGIKNGDDFILKKQKVEYLYI
jgi:hypothetical protein